MRNVVKRLFKRKGIKVYRLVLVERLESRVESKVVIFSAGTAADVAFSLVDVLLVLRRTCEPF